MAVSTRNYWRNWLKLRRGTERLLRPLAVVYHLTSHCNLNCAYCEYFGARRNAQAAPHLPGDQALRVLRVIRTGTDALILTGGEPLLHPDSGALILQARRKLRFRQITLLTNGLLLPAREEMLPALDRLVVSLDAVDAARWSSILGAPRAVVETILENVRRYARRQREFGYRMIANCVLTPETLPGALDVLDFCAAHDMLVSYSPQAVGNWPRYELLVSPDYRAFIERLIVLKRHGAPLVGSMAYLRALLDFRSYSCYPTLTPRVMPDGSLTYPCWPIERAGGSHGGRPCRLSEVSSWQEALAVSFTAYGPPPRVCTSCFQQCYAEPSLMQARPWSWLWEWLRYPPSRQGDLLTYAPG